MFAKYSKDAEDLLNGERIVNKKGQRTSLYKDINYDMDFELDLYRSKRKSLGDILRKLCLEKNPKGNAMSCRKVGEK